MKILNKTPNGQISFCEGHGCFHIEFGNVFVHLTQEEMETLRAYIVTVNPQYYEQVNRNTINRRKILLNLGTKRIYLSLTSSEFYELKELLSLRGNSGILINSEIIGSITYN